MQSTGAVVVDRGRMLGRLPAHAWLPGFERTSACHAHKTTQHLLLNSISRNIPCPVQNISPDHV